MQRYNVNGRMYQLVVVATVSGVVFVAVLVVLMMVEVVVVRW